MGIYKRLSLMCDSLFYKKNSLETKKFKRVSLGGALVT